MTRKAGEIGQLHRLSLLVRQQLQRLTHTYTVGLPFGPHAGQPEQLNPLVLASKLTELAFIWAATRLFETRLVTEISSTRPRIPVARLAPSSAGCLLLVDITVSALTTPVHGGHAEHSGHAGSAELSAHQHHVDPSGKAQHAETSGHRH